MGRSREFDEDAVLDASVRAFWKNGYRGTSTSELCAETGLGRSSLYNAFESKDAIFERALERYAGQAEDEHIAALEASAPAIDVLHAYLLDAARAQFAHEERQGCLAVNAAVELGQSEPAVARIVRDDFDATIGLFRTLLARAQVEGDVSTSSTADGLARLAHVVLGGVRIQARVATTEIELTCPIDVFVDSIRAPRPDTA